MMTMKKLWLAAVLTLCAGATASAYDLTVAPNGHGTVVFSVGGTAVTTADAGALVTITVTPDEGYTMKGVSARAYTTWRAALRGGQRPPELLDDIALTKQQDGTWTLTMPEADVELEAAYYTLLPETNDGAWLWANDGQTADIQLGRTLQTGGWNTLALPFTIDAATLGLSAAKELESATLENYVLTLNFQDATVIEAGKPYLVKVAENVVNPTFDGVLVSDALVPTETAVVDFIPTLGATTITGDDAKTVLFLAAENKLKNPTALPTDMKGFRAYFQLKGEGAQVKAFQLNLGEDEATGIIAIEHGTLNINQSVYDLSGRRVANGQSSMVNGQSLKKGVYIVNGKKTIIK